MRTLFRHAWICASTVKSSLNVSFTPPTTRRRWVFALLTAASQRLPKSGLLCSGMKCHCMARVEQNSVMVCPTLHHDRNPCISFSSRLAPANWPPLSLQIRVSDPQRGTKHHTVAMKALLVKSETASKWTTLTVSDTNMHMYACTVIGLHTIPYLTCRGPS